LPFVVFATSLCFSQGKIYIITEQYSGMNNTSLDKVIVTDPSGGTETYDITHFLIDVAKHDSELCKIFNNVTAKGFSLTDSSPNAHGDIKGVKNLFTRTWFLIEK
jgi:hypothetical protein